MTSEIEEEAQRLNEKLQYWADTLDLPMDDINADAASWFEYVTKSDDPLITEFTDFVDEKVALHTPDYPIMVLIFLTAAAMSLLSYRKVNRPEQPDLISLIRAAEQLAMLEGLVSSTVLEREARSRKLSQGGKRGAQVKHEGVSKLKRWAVSEAQAARGADKEISRQLARKIPVELAGVSKDPERVIYDAIRAARKDNCGSRMADSA